jgi:hypothetical protein
MIDDLMDGAASQFRSDGETPEPTAGALRLGATRRQAAVVCGPFRLRLLSPD